MKINLCRLSESRWICGLSLLVIAIVLAEALRTTIRKQVSVAGARQNNPIVNLVKPARLPSVGTAEDQAGRKVPGGSRAGFADAESGTQVYTPSSEGSEVEVSAETAPKQTRSVSGASGISVEWAMKPPAGVPVPRIPVVADTRFQLPLAFQPVNPEALTPATQNKLTQLQQQFVQAIGDTTNPADPTYQNRWITAQIQSDMQYRALFGQMAFQEMQIQRAQGASTQAQ
jgi:hypothetical protein